MENKGEVVMIELDEQLLQKLDEAASDAQISRDDYIKKVIELAVTEAEVQKLKLEISKKIK